MTADDAVRTHSAFNRALRTSDFEALSKLYVAEGGTYDWFTFRPFRYRRSQDAGCAA
jgi:hypothetical protein